MCEREVAWEVGRVSEREKVDESERNVDADRSPAGEGFNAVELYMILTNIYLSHFIV